MTDRPATGPPPPPGGPTTAGRQLFLGLIGAPYASDLLTSAVRIAEEAVRQGHRVTVWTCGHATALTTPAVGLAKPRNLAAWDTSYPSPAALVRHLLAWAQGELEWLVCRFCADERGTTDQLPEVRVRPSYEFMVRANAADVSLVLGVK